MRPLLACAVVLSLLPARAVASAPERLPPDPSIPDAPRPLLDEPLRVGEPPPRGDHMVKAGMFFTVFGSLTFATSSIVMNHLAWRGGESWGFGFVTLSPLVASGGLVTLGALLLHFGQERRWAHADWAAGRGPIDRAKAPHSGAGMLLAGPLTLAASATAFTWGLEELTHLDVTCNPEPEPFSDCWEGDTKTATLLLSTAGAGVLLGTTLIVLGANRRGRYMNWRIDHERPIELRPKPWVSLHGFGLGLQGQF